MIYGEPVPLRGDDRRIYAPWSYERLASAAILPIVASEVEALSGAFPIVWAQEADTLALCVLRTFRQDGLGLLPIPKRLEVLPLLAVAYPVRLDAAGASLCLDDVVAENPTDGGAPLFEASGTPSAGLEMKVSALSRYRANLAFTQSLTEALQERDLLEPWQIPTKDIENPWQRPFLIWSRTRDANAQLPHIVSEFGPLAATLWSLQRISLYAAGRMFELAQQKALASLALEASEETTQATKAAGPESPST